MEIPQEIFDTYYSTADDFIDSNFGVTCTLYYPEKKVDCENCIYDPMLKASSNKYQTGGPISFTTGICPYCNGLGYRSSVPTDTIKLRAYYDRKSWVKMPVPLTIPDGAVQCFGHMADLPKLMRCKEILLNTAISGYTKFTYILYGEPYPHGFKKNKYFIAILARK